MKKFGTLLFVAVCFLWLSGCKGDYPATTLPVQEATHTPTLPSIFPSTPTETATPGPTPVPTPTEELSDYEKAGLWGTVEGFYHRPFEDLPQKLRNSLEWDGKRQPHEIYRCYLRYYTGPNIVIVTTEATEEALRDWLDGQLSMPEGDEARIGTDEEIRAEYELECGREWLYSVIITDDSYATVLGLKVGNTVEEAESLGYDLGRWLDKNGNGEASFGNHWDHQVDVQVENNVVTELYLSWGLGRNTGKYFDL